MIRTKVTIVVLSVIIVLLATSLVIKQTSHQDVLERKDIILHNFDQADIDRLNEMVQRHENGKGDYLMLIPPIIDGGYWIHDVHSDGREITWTIDNTRDGMSSERGKQIYRCKSISQHETKEQYVYTLSQCDNQGEKSFPILSISKSSHLR
jgi:hypothetical protein